MSDYKQAKRLEGRNGSVYVGYCMGSTQEHLAEEFHMSISNVRRIIQQVQADLPELDRGELRDRLQETALHLSKLAIDEAHRDAPPIVDQKGNWVRDPDTHAVVRDYSHRLAAIGMWIKVSERISRLAGTDAPVRHEIEQVANAAAIEQAEKVAGQFPGLRAVS